MANTRAAIVAATEHVIREHGIAHATTRRIAEAAGYSEATLYKHFADKQDLYLTALIGAAPTIGDAMDALAGAADAGALRSGLEEVANAALEFYRRAAPLGASFFADPRLLEAFRGYIGEQGLGPHLPLELLADQLAAARTAGLLKPDADVHAAAALLLGACFQQAFFSWFTDRARATDAADAAGGPAAALVSTVLDPLID